MENKLELEQRELLQRVVSNELHWVDALKLIQPIRKAWHRREWKEQRKLLLGTQCESCGTTTPPLVLQHTWHPTPLYRLFYKARKKYQREWLAWKQSHAVDVDTSSVSANADGCPKCGSTAIRYRKRAKTWICVSRPAGSPCGHVFDQPVRVISQQTIRKLERAARQRVQDDFDDQSGIGRKVTITAIEQQIRYLSLKDTKTLCKRCAFVEDRTRMVLCAVCKENYHFKKYDRCSGCAGTRSP